MSDELTPEQRERFRAEGERAEAAGSGLRDVLRTGQPKLLEPVTFNPVGGELVCSGCGWSMAWEAETLCKPFKHCPGCTATVMP